MAKPLRRVRARPRAVVLALVAGACGGRYGEARRPAGAVGVEAAGLPYAFVEARTGRELPADAALARLGAARVLCVGEEHSNPHHHWAQLEVVRLVVTPTAPARQWALGMEMFQRPFQGVLDDFAAGRIDEPTLLSRAGWAERWGFDFGLYRPIIRRAVDAPAALVALNPAKELVKKVSRQGLAALTEAERAQLPELRLDDAAHRAWWDEIMAEMGQAHGHGKAAPAPAPTPEPQPAGQAPTALPPGHPPVPPSNSAADEAAELAAEADAQQRMYSVQVLWDESMADGAARFVAGGPTRHMVILAGNGHCHDAGVITRLRRRGVGDALSILPLVDDGENVAAELARPRNDLLLVMRRPATAAPQD